MAKRTLQELNLLDDFLCGTMLTYPEIGDKFIRELLRIIFHREFGKLNIVSQKTYYGSDMDKPEQMYRSTRDVCKMMMGSKDLKN